MWTNLFNHDKSLQQSSSLFIILVTSCSILIAQIIIIIENIFAEVESVDFSRSQEAANLINTWCANTTKNHINDIVTPGMSTLFIFHSIHRKWGFTFFFKNVYCLFNTSFFPYTQMTLHVR